MWIKEITVDKRIAEASVRFYEQAFLGAIYSGEFREHMIKELEGMQLNKCDTIKVSYSFTILYNDVRMLDEVSKKSTSRKSGKGKIKVSKLSERLYADHDESI